MSILIVDDSKVNRSLMQAVLKSAGYADLLSFPSAKDALTSLGMDAPNGGVDNVELILMDVMMPEIDGMEACRRIRAADHLRDIPVIMVTALSDVRSMEAAFDAGATDYITKPVKKLEVLARVGSALSLKRETDARRLAFAELEEKNRELARELLAKSQILSTVSHELKTPLTNVMGYADRLLLRQAQVGELNERQQRYVQAIRESSSQLTILINDLLDITRIEAGSLQLFPTTFEARDSIEGVLRNMRVLLAEKETRVDLCISSGSCTLHADEARFSQVVTNLLSNACKYSPRGATVTISVQEVGDFLQVDVKDTGIGISESDQQKLFTKFFRANNSATRTESGTGLGLFIAKQLVDAQGGSIWAHSQEGSGSTFSFTLPRGEADIAGHDAPAEKCAVVNA